MSRCTCPERPRCEYHHCHEPADWSFFTAPVRWVKIWPHGRLHFMCTPCKDYYVAALSQPLKGIDKPKGADEEWKPSLLDHLRHGEIALAFAERNERDAATQPHYLDDYWRWYEVKRGFTPEQTTNLRTHRMLMRKYLPTPGAT